MHKTMTAVCICWLKLYKKTLPLWITLRTTTLKFYKTRWIALTIADVLFSTSKVCNSYMISLLLMLGKYKLMPMFLEVLLVFNI
jgi:hypothetical protein